MVFYQPDLELYEMESGRLIPSDDEYIGARVFDLKALEETLQNIIQDGRIILDKARTSRDEACYQTINEFSDGKNLTRIYQKLVKKKIV